MCNKNIIKHRKISNLISAYLVLTIFICFVNQAYGDGLAPPTGLTYIMDDVSTGVEILEGEAYSDNKSVIDLSTATFDSKFTLYNPLQKANIMFVISSSMFKGIQDEKYLYVNLAGTVVNASSLGGLANDIVSARGWFLEKVTARIAPQDDDVNYVGATDFSGGIYVGTVTNTISDTITASVGADAGGKFTTTEQGLLTGITTSLGFTEQTSFTHSLEVEEIGISSPVATSKSVSIDYNLRGVYLDNEGGLTQYNDVYSLLNHHGYDFQATSDWADFNVLKAGTFFLDFEGKGFRISQLYDLPQLAKSGLPINHQVLFKTEKDQLVTVRCEIEVNLLSVVITGTSKIDQKGTFKRKTLKSHYDIIVDFGFNYPVVDETASLEDSEPDNP
jgi:hypothetical protein